MGTGEARLAPHVSLECWTLQPLTLGTSVWYCTPYYATALSLLATWHCHSPPLSLCLSVLTCCPLPSPSPCCCLSLLRSVVARLLWWLLIVLAAASVGDGALTDDLLLPLYRLYVGPVVGSAVPRSVVARVVC